MASTLGMESGRHWWEASAFTTAPSLPVKTNYQASSSQHPKFILMKSNSLQFKVIIFTAVQYVSQKILAIGHSVAN